MPVIPGDDSPETLIGSNDSDTITGRGGDDVIYGWYDPDLLYGGTGNDTIYGGDLNDTLYGGAGDDELQGGGGLDQINGDGGNDVIWMGTNTGAATGTADAGGGNDTVNVNEVAGGSALGGTGTDRVHFHWLNDSSADNVTLDFATGTAISSSGLSFGFSGFESLGATLGNGDDTVAGSGQGDDIDAGAGRNAVQAGAGDDRVSYDVGQANTLNGGGGSGDVLVAHTLPGATLYFIHNGTTGMVDDGQLSDIRNFEHYEVWGGDGHDIVSLGDGDDWADGAGGNDTLFGKGGDDHLIGRGGRDSLHGEGGHDTLVGAAGDDVLYGGGGNDRLMLVSGLDVAFGDAGDDRLVFRGGNQLGWGDAGADTFLIRGADPLWFSNIGDYTQGEDRLVLDTAILPGAVAGPLDPGLLTYGNQSVGTHGQFLHFSVAGDSMLFWDADGSGSGQPLPLVLFGNNIVLTAADIILI